MQAGGGDGGSPKRSSLGGSATSMLLARRSASGSSVMSEINVTPFVDVVLVLLIIFMITAPMLVRAFDVNLPAAGIRNDSPSERLLVTLDAQGRTYLNEKAVNKELLEERLKEAVEVEGRRVAYLRADENLRYAEVISLIDLMKRAGVDTIGLNYVYPEEKR